MSDTFKYSLNLYIGTGDDGDYNDLSPEQDKKLETFVNDKKYKNRINFHDGNSIRFKIPS